MRIDFKVEADRELTPKEEKYARRRMQQLLGMVDEELTQSVTVISETLPFDKKSSFRFDAEIVRKDQE